jgi:hypothetical protein
LGSAQLLPDGRMFVGWGSQPHFSEFAADGRLVLDATIIKGSPSYRAFTQDWAGHPADAPAAAADARHHSSGATIYASWNGATNVASWTVYAGKTRTSLTRIGSARRSGFETAITVHNAGLTSPCRLTAPPAAHCPNPRQSNFLDLAAPARMSSSSRDCRDGAPREAPRNVVSFLACGLVEADARQGPSRGTKPDRLGVDVSS